MAKSESFELPERGFVFWPVGTGDSATIVVDSDHVIQVDLRHLEDSNENTDPHVPIIDELESALPELGGKPYLAAFILTHPDEDHCQGFAQLLERVSIGEIWFSPRILSEFDEDLCDDAIAFKDEVERRVKLILDGSDESGDRLRLVGYADVLEDEDYVGLASEILLIPGDSTSVIDGADLAPDFSAFIHAPFKDDSEAERNDTSIAMQVTLSEAEKSCTALLLGDLSNPTLRRIFEVSDAESLAWNLLLAPHHCSKTAMYTKDQDGEDQLDSDLLKSIDDAGGVCRYVIASSAPIPSSNQPGDNPPHAKAKSRYEELVDAGHFLCTQEHPNEDSPVPISFSVADVGCEHQDTEGEPKSKKSLAAAVQEARGSARPPQQEVKFGDLTNR